MNIIRELRKKKGIKQEELAAALGVSSPAVSYWETGKSDPSGENLKKLAEFFGVDELVILGKADPVVGPMKLDLFMPEDPEKCGVSETEQIIQRLLQKLDAQPRTYEARILSAVVDRVPKQQREQALNVVRAMFSPQYADLFTKGDDDK